MPRMNIKALIWDPLPNRIQLHFDSQEMAEAFLSRLQKNEGIGEVPAKHRRDSKTGRLLPQFQNNPFGSVPVQSHDRKYILNFPFYRPNKDIYDLMGDEDQEYAINFGTEEARDGFIKTMAWATGHQPDEVDFSWFAIHGGGQNTAVYIKKDLFSNPKRGFTIPTSKRGEYALKSQLRKIEYEHLLESVSNPDYARQNIAKHPHIEEFIQLALCHADKLFRDVALQYCLTQLGDYSSEEREPMIAKMAAATQRGRESVCHFLLNIYVKAMLEKNAAMMPGLLEKVLLARHIEKLGVTDNPELLEAALNAVFLPNYQIPPDMPLKFKTPYETPSAVIDTRASFGQLRVRLDIIRALYNLLWQDGHFSPDKLAKIIQAERGEFFREIPFEKTALRAIGLCARNRHFSDFGQLGLFGDTNQKQQCIRRLAGVDTQTDDAHVIHAKLKSFTQRVIREIPDLSKPKNAAAHQEHPQERPRAGKRSYPSALFHDQVAADAQAPKSEAAARAQPQPR
ncbi:hypothetical protein [Piscirickettsia salmonis]|uniref:hypothetical protein n=1 Tax=Piscirickettsia salmonis TaxID=1238 RepID=UPI0007C973FA|nr:hypothetical protein A0O36_00270 [Piscirickettsiaceae bacterium NZ-RLO1]